MATVPELIRVLTEKEGERVAAELQARLRVEEAEAKVEHGARENNMMRRRMAQEIHLARAQLDKRLRESHYECRKAVAEELSEAREEGIKALKVERSLANAKANLFTLEEKKRELEAYLRQQTAVTEQSLAWSELLLGARARRIAAQGQQRLDSMQTHAMQVGDVAQNHLDMLRGQLQAQAARVLKRAEGKVRLKELTDLTRRRLTNEMTTQEVASLKDELLALWHKQTQAINAACPNILPRHVVETHRSPTPDAIALTGQLA